MNHENDETKVNELIDWFNEEYEDPAQHVSYDSGEGGYQYVNGGPYDASEVLSEEYPEIEEGLISRAVKLITNEGTEWVKKGQY